MPWFPFIAGIIMIGWGVLLFVYRQRLIASDSAARDAMPAGWARRLIFGPRMGLQFLAFGIIVLGAVLLVLGLLYVVLHGWS